jgi:PIN domain nuclease of toxin-antitoxin system
MMTTDGLLLDTCAMIWLSEGAGISDSAKAVIERARRANAKLCVSAISAWEIGLLVAKDKLPAVTEPLRWFNDFLSAGGVAVELLTPDILIASSFLPEMQHKDPADRIITATARANNLAIVTRDPMILAYGAAGHVKTVRC